MSRIEACADTVDVCKRYNASLTESCIVDGITLEEFPKAGV